MIKFTIRLIDRQSKKQTIVYISRSQTNCYEELRISL